MSPMLLSFALALSPAAGYAKPDLLVDPADLAKLAETAKRPVRVLDARPEAKYEEGHVPGAIRVGEPAWAKTFAAGQDPADWTKRIAALGIAPSETVVIYDDNLSKDAARVWYILRYWGFDDVRILNGGWKGWLAAGGKPDKAPTAVDKVRIELKPEPQRLTTKQQLLDQLKANPPQIVDARSEGEYCGTQETAKRNGAIPGAKHLEWSDTLDKDTGKFKSADELAKLFEKAGIDPAKPSVTYCQSGGRAAVLAFVLELMGGKDVRNYYRSWAEWGNDPDTPVVKPEK